MAHATLFTLPKQGRFAAARKCNAILDAHCTTVGLIEDCAPRIVAHCENKFLPFFDFGARLENHID